MTIMIGRCRVRSSERTCEHSRKPSACSRLKTDDHEIEFAVRQAQQRVRGIGLALHVMLLVEGLHDALGRAIAILNQENASTVPEPIEPDPQRGGEAHLLLGRGAHQHLVGKHFESRQVPRPRDQRDVVDRLGQKVVGARLEPLHSVGRLVERRDDDHRDVLRARLGLKPPADLETVHAGHHHVE